MKERENNIFTFYDEVVQQGEKEQLLKQKVHGLEINPRAAKIAEMVLWIGYLQWHFRTQGA